jgi:hypothetical protein
MRILLRAGPFAFLAAVGVGLVLAWQRLPARYPVHWGAGGVDRWADLSARSVGAPLLMGLVGVTWIGLLRRFVLAHSSPAPDPARSRRLTVSITIAAQWMLAAVFGLGAIPRQGPGLVLAGAGLGCILLPVALIATYTGEPPVEEVRPPPHGGWLFVAREDGTGLRIERRHPLFWTAVALLAAGPIALSLAGLAL